MRQFETTAAGAEGIASSREIDLMASVLEGRHGVLAIEIAEFLAAAHEQTGDLPRAGAWFEVSLTIRRRETARITGRRH